MKILFAFFALTVGIAQADPVCRDVYDAMNNRWVLVCTDSSAPTPQCKNVYDPMNNVWVLVCQ